MKLSIPDFKQQIAQATKHLDEVQKKQVPQATAWALNDVAFMVRSEEKKTAARVFDNPTAATRNLVYIGKEDRATKRNLRVRIWLNDYRNQDRYLQAQIEGGQRRHKRSEILLQQRGLMPRGQYIVPGQAARKNRNGNLSQGQVQKIISALGAQHDSQQNTKDKRKKVYFSGEVRGTNGIWQRTVSGPRPVMIFVKSASYKKRLDFHGVGQRVFSTRFMGVFNQRMARALKTAR